MTAKECITGRRSIRQYTEDEIRYVTDEVKQLLRSLADG